VARVLWPPKSTALAEARNERSLVLRLEWQGQALALLCGDVGRLALGELARRGDVAAQVLVLPHHGSGDSLHREFYRAVNPSLALAGTGYANRWGFPALAVRKALDAQGIPLLHTGASGQITVRWNGGSPDGFTVETAVRDDG
jgi:competence protein ComEC